MEHKSTSQVLHEAADWIQRQGWNVGDGWPSSAPPPENQTLCLEGGIMAALGLTLADIQHDLDVLIQTPAYQAVVQYLGPRLGDPFLYRWNDRWGRMEQDVIAVLRAAAETVRCREEVTA